MLRSGQSLVGTVCAIDVTPFDSFEANRNSLRIGEAALGLDPLSSSGLSVAMQSALAGAATVRTLLDPDGDHEAALEYGATSHARRRTQHALHTARAYASAAQRHEGAFWRDRAGDALKSKADAPPPLTPLPQTGTWLQRATHVRIAPTACVTDGRIERIRAIHGRDASEPVAFVDGVAVAPLLDRVPTAIRAGDLLLDWAGTIGTRTALSLLSWAWRKEILVDCSAQCSAGR